MVQLSPSESFPSRVALLLPGPSFRAVGLFKATGVWLTALQGQIIEPSRTTTRVRPRKRALRKIIAFLPPSAFHSVIVISSSLQSASQLLLDPRRIFLGHHG